MTREEFADAVKPLKDFALRVANEAPLAPPQLRDCAILFIRAANGLADAVADPKCSEEDTRPNVTNRPEPEEVAAMLAEVEDESDS